jgi:hypothetical protein
MGSQAPLKRIARDEHSSLFAASVSDERKKSHITSAPSHAGVSRTKSREISKSKNCCKHSDNSSRSHKSKESKVPTENASQQTSKSFNDNNDDDDSLIGSHFIPDHVKSLIPERV